jgi:hypothetical protein
MIRTLLHRALPLAIACLLAAPAASAKETPKGKDAKTSDAKTSETKTSETKGGKPDKGKKADSKKADPKKTDAKGAAGKPVQVGSFGEWGAFTAQGKGKTCYALAKPKERAPASLKRDDAYVFISNRPGENVRNEISIIMGFSMKDGAEPKADIGGVAFELVAKGGNAWVKNPAEEGRFIDAMKKGAKLVVRATSIKGNASTDTYLLSGLSDALARIQKDCP